MSTPKQGHRRRLHLSLSVSLCLSLYLLTASFPPNLPPISISVSLSVSLSVTVSPSRAVVGLAVARLPQGGGGGGVKRGDGIGLDTWLRSLPSPIHRYDCSCCCCFCCFCGHYDCFLAPQAPRPAVARCCHPFLPVVPAAPRETACIFMYVCVCVCVCSGAAFSCFAKTAAVRAVPARME